MIKSILQKPDVLGATASVLCIIHCLATPLIFIAHTCAVGGGKSAPSWWGGLDYVFLVISFFAIKQSIKNSSKSIIKFALGFNWVVLFLLILNETFSWFYLPETVTHVVALLLALLHLYNVRYCQCKNEACCSN